MDFTRITEQDSDYDHLEKMSIRELLTHINDEDTLVADLVAKAIPAIENLTEAVIAILKSGGRLFYIGAGTSGRLGILDASECPPTYGIPHDRVIALIAGGDSAIRKAVEFAEDDTRRGWKDLQKHNVTDQDIVVGITASGTTPYVISAIETCNKNGITTGGITCNAGSPLAISAKFPIIAIVGPEFVTGSSRMKAGTAQKMILNMISTTTMIRLGRVLGNKMIDMQLSNNKLIDRGINMVMKESGVNATMAGELLDQHGSVRLAVIAAKKLR